MLRWYFTKKLFSFVFQTSFYFTVEFLSWFAPRLRSNGEKANAWYNRVFFRSDILLEGDNLIGIRSTPPCKLFKQICFDILQKELWFSSFVLVFLLLLLLLLPAAARLANTRGPTWHRRSTRKRWTSGLSRSRNVRAFSTLLMLSDDKENEIFIQLLLLLLLLLSLLLLMLLLLMLLL